MLIGKIQGATRTLGLEQGYEGLPLRDESMYDPVSKCAVPVMVSSWEPTPADLAALNAGAPLHLHIVGTAHPPIMLAVGPTPD